MEKATGISFVEVNVKLQYFRIEDKSHSRSKEIFSVSMSSSAILGILPVQKNPLDNVFFQVRDVNQFHYFKDGIVLVEISSEALSYMNPQATGMHEIITFFHCIIN